MLRWFVFFLIVSFSTGKVHQYLRAVRPAEVSRRRLLELCTFASNRVAAFNPSCRGDITWEMDEATGDGKIGSYKLTHYNHRCCTDKRFGFTAAGKFQLGCTDTNYGAVFK